MEVTEYLINRMRNTIDQIQLYYHEQHQDFNLFDLLRHYEQLFYINAGIRSRGSSESNCITAS